MPGHMLAQVRLARTSFNPEDTVVNTFHFLTAAGTSTPAERTAITSRLQAFYTSVQGLLSGLIAGTGHEIRLYEMDDPEPRVPVANVALTLAPTGTSLPAEVALCLSYKAVPSSGQPAARLRGRIYLGPLDSSLLAAESGADARPSTGTQDTLLGAGTTLMNQASGPFWIVYSAANEAAGLGGFAEVNDCWVDNAWDTQRRRGADPTSRRTSTRTTFPT